MNHTKFLGGYANRSIVEQYVVVRTKNNNVFRHIRSVMGGTQWLNVMRFGVRFAIAQTEGLAADLTSVLVKCLDLSRQFRISQNSKRLRKHPIRRDNFFDIKCLWGGPQVGMKTPDTSANSLD